MLDMLKLKNLASGVTDNILGSGNDKVRAAVDEVMIAIRALEPLGFTFPWIAVKVALIPAVVIEVDRSRVRRDADLSILQLQMQNKPVARAVINSIMSADALARAIVIPGRKLDSYEMEITVPPTIALRYRQVPVGDGAVADPRC
jgi:hypothetical protein